MRQTSCSPVGSRPQPACLVSEGDSGLNNGCPRIPRLAPPVAHLPPVGGWWATGGARRQIRAWGHVLAHHLLHQPGKLAGVDSARCDSRTGRAAYAIGPATALRDSGAGGGTTIGKCLSAALLMWVVGAANVCATGSGDAPLVIDPIDSQLNLDEQAAYEVGILLRDAPIRWLTPGWSGLDTSTNASLNTQRLHAGRPALFVHPPYGRRTGCVVQQYTVRLPADPTAKLRGATATAEEAGQGDGVTFRVRADDQLLWERHHTSVAWQEFAVDLSPWAGKTVVLRFETDCGPADNTTYDWAFWSDRVIALPDYRAQSPELPDPPALDLTRLSAQPNGDVTPLSAFEGERTVTVDAVTGEAQLRYSGADGELLYRWNWPRQPGDAPIGRWTLRATMTGGQAVEIPLATGNAIDWTGPARLLASDVEALGDAVRCVSTWRVGDGDASLETVARLAGKSVVVEIACDQPVIAQLQAGRWGPVAHQQRLNVPYYPGPVELLKRQNLFVGALVDWTASSGSSLIESGAVYKPLTDGTYNPLRERVIFTAAWHLAEVLPNLPHPASPTAHNWEVASCSTSGAEAMPTSPPHWRCWAITASRIMPSSSMTGNITATTTACRRTIRQIPDSALRTRCAS
jgi:hypothetical protein